MPGGGRLALGQAIEQMVVKGVLDYLPPRPRSVMNRALDLGVHGLEEIRIRLTRPLCIVTDAGDFFLQPNGEPTTAVELAYQVTRDDIDRMMQLISRSSVYAFAEELRRGYITVPGGHRIGIAGRTVLNGDIKTIKDVTSFNVRIAHEICGAADQVMPFLIRGDSRFVPSTLIISPPRCGKTTLLRDIARQISDGVKGCACQVGIVDERSEIAACYQGVPQHDVGCRTDVLDGCPKAQGMLMLIRSMSPDVIITDEIGGCDDARAIQDARNAGVSVLASAHAANLDELNARPVFRHIVELGIFRYIIQLSRRQGPGTIDQVHCL